MKLKEIAIVVFVLATFTYAGCNKIKEALDVTFDTTFSTDLDIDVQPESRDINAGWFFSESATIDMTANTQVNEYKDQLKNATTKAVTFTVTSISEEPVNLTNLIISISHNGVGLVDYTEVDHTITNGFSFSIDEDQLDGLNTIILQAQGMTVTISGNTNVAPVQFTFKTEIDAEIVANPL